MIDQPFNLSCKDQPTLCLMLQLWPRRQRSVAAAEKKRYQSQLQLFHSEITWEAGWSERGSVHLRTPGNRPKIDFKGGATKIDSYLGWEGVEHEIKVAHLIPPCWSYSRGSRVAGGVVRASARSNFYLWQVHRIIKAGNPQNSFNSHNSATQHNPRRSHNSHHKLFTSQASIFTPRPQTSLS